MDKVTVFAIVLMPSAVWAWGKLVDYLERRRDRKEAKEADYHSRSVVVQAPLRLGSDSGSSEDSGSGSEPRQGI